MSLSKTSFIKGLQCHKYVYLYKHHSKFRDWLSPEKLSKFKRGTDIGYYAQQFFPGGIDLKPKSHYHYKKALELTAFHVEQKTPVIYEASFMYNDVLIFLDILTYKDGHWYAYEVKSSLEISETYLNDAALQYYVLSGTGIPVRDMSLIYMNEKYTRKGEVDVFGLFSIQSVLDDVLSRQQMISSEVIKQKEILANESIPEREVGVHCYTPYDCDFLGYCWKKYRHTNSILNVEFLGIEKRFDLLEKGFETIEQLNKNAELDGIVSLRIQCLFDKKDYIDKPVLEAYLNKVGVKSCYIDVLGFKSAFPLVENASPYNFFPFSVTVVPVNEINNTTHYYYTHVAGTHVPFIEFLNQIALQYDSIITYDKLFLLNALRNINHNEASVLLNNKSFTDKLIGIKEVFNDGLFISSKINGTFDFENVLTELNLKNTFKKKDINNIYEATAVFMDNYAVDNKQIMQDAMQSLLSYSSDNIRYLDRLISFLKKKI
ncbi:MAG: hypothetical protein PHT69_10615 [Bacteroidales bacterium]|nr:hypothetical protein [Bacteroidales bacterium]